VTHATAHIVEAVGYPGSSSPCIRPPLRHALPGAADRPRPGASTPPRRAQAPARRRSSTASRSIGWNTGSSASAPRSAVG